jgi:hypothetical protein
MGRLQVELAFWVWAGGRSRISSCVIDDNSTDGRPVVVGGQERRFSVEL